MLRRTRANDLADINEQLQTENKELRRQVLELQWPTDPDERPVRGAELLARMVEILHDDLQQIIAAAMFYLGLMRNRAKHDASLQAIGSKIDDRLKEAIEKSRGLAVAPRWSLQGR